MKGKAVRRVPRLPPCPACEL